MTPKIIIIHKINKTTIMASSLLPDAKAVQAAATAAQAIAQDAIQDAIQAAAQAINIAMSAHRAEKRRENSQTYTQKKGLFDFLWDFYPGKRYRRWLAYPLLAKTLPKMFTTLSIRDPSKHQDQELRTACEDIARGYFGPNIPSREAYQHMEDFELEFKDEFYNSSSFDYRFSDRDDPQGWSHDGHCFIIERNTSDDPVSDKPVVYFPVMVSKHDNLAYNRAGDRLGRWDYRHHWHIGHVTANYFTTPSFD
tara:strand:+ start:2889 stop:3641 length:753 start_codon:yes stop_codon:yes gene_type:complete